MEDVILQSVQCSTDLWTNGSFWEAVNCPYDESVGVMAKSFLVLFALGAGATIFTRNIVIPLALVLLFGGLIGAFVLPAAPITIVGILVLVAFGIVGIRLFMSLLEAG